MEFKDYEEAARIRDSLKSFEEGEPVLRLRRLLKEAITEERFEVPILRFIHVSGFLLLGKKTTSSEFLLTHFQCVETKTRLTEGWVWKL